MKNALPYKKVIVVHLQSGTISLLSLVRGNFQYSTKFPADTVPGQRPTVAIFKSYPIMITGFLFYTYHGTVLAEVRR